MNVNPNHDFSLREPLTGVLGEFTPELIEIDALLAEQARCSGVPSELSDRVYLASVSMLPATGDSYRFAEVAVRHEARQNGQRWIGRLRFRSISGQVAMAASLAMAFGIAVWFVQRPHSNFSSTAQVDVESEIALASALRPMHGDTAGALEGQFDYLLETNDMTSPDDITNELAMLVRELEM
jgi:hypothetical protein